MQGGFTPEDFGFYREFLDNFSDVSGRSKTEAIGRCTDPEGLHSNGDQNPSLSIGLSQNGKGPTIVMNCLSQGCDKEMILAAIGLTTKDLYPNQSNGHKKTEPDGSLPGCTLEQYAEFKSLPLEFLKSDDVGLEDDTYWCPVTQKEVSAVYIPYAAEDGDELEKCATWRTGLHKTDPDTRIRRLSRKKGGELSLYGLHGLEEAREAGYVLLVEGESDCHVAWYQELPALGIPGAKNWKDEWAEHLRDIPTIYVMVEPDEAGAGLWKAVSRCKAFASRVRKVVP